MHQIRSFVNYEGGYVTDKEYWDQSHRAAGLRRLLARAWYLAK